jgi:L-ascorbate metabolism protein UlaG (beta-lactamase superfamily)
VTTGSLYFIGTATTLLRLGPFTLLTDPNFLHQGQRAWLGRGLTAKRLTEPALDPDDLPELDAVVLSHLHGDHWDRVAHAHLAKDVPILTTPHAARRLRARGRRTLGMRTWESTSTTRDGMRLTVTALPGRHAPRPVSRLLPPVMGTMLEIGPAPDGAAGVGPAPAGADGAARAYAAAGVAGAAPPAGEADRPTRVYLSGDTLLVDELAEIGARYPGIDTAVLHLGGTTLPGGLVVTMDGEQGAGLVELLRPSQVVPIHLDDYRLFKSPLADFLAATERRGLRDRVTPVPRGGDVAIGRVGAPHA